MLILTRRWRGCVAASTAALLLLTQDGSAFDHLFTVSGDGIWYAQTDGTGLTRIAKHETEFYPAGIVYNPADRFVYWSRHYDGIRRSDLDGTQFGDFLVREVAEEPIIDPHALAIDIGAAHLYWSEGVGGRIFRAEYQNPENWDVVVQDIPAWVNGLALDTVAQQIYWSEAADCSLCYGTIRRANFDGTDIETIVPEIPGGGTLALDVPRG